MATRNLARLRDGLGFFVLAASVAFAFTAVTSREKGDPAVEHPILKGSNVPVAVQKALRRACSDCHSANTVWPWYAQVPWISRQIHEDVAKGRAFLDLSKWNEYSESQRRGFMAAIGAAVQGHVMPPTPYTWMHRDARLTDADVKAISAWAFARQAPTPARAAVR